jgi:hypothetical protein
MNSPTQYMAHEARALEVLSDVYERGAAEPDEDLMVVVLSSLLGLVLFLALFRILLVASEILAPQMMVS